MELLLRAEELFVISIADDEAGDIRTVGDLYQLICSKLNVTSPNNPITSEELPTRTDKKKTFLFLSRHTPLPAPPEVLPWSPQSLWDTLVAVIVDQLSLDPEEIPYSARFVQDLGVA